MIITDASVWVSRIIDDEVGHSASRAWFQACRAAEVPMMAPSLLLAEVAGAVCRRTAQPALASTVLDDLLGLSALQLVSADSSLCARAARLAIALRLRGADATYCVLAEMLGVPLVTWDREMIDRCQGVIEVVTPTEHLARLAP